MNFKFIFSFIILLHFTNITLARPRILYDNLDENFDFKNKRSNEYKDKVKENLFNSLHEKYHKIGTERGFQISTAFDFVVENGRIVLKPRDNNDNHYFIG
jgi:5-carboxymethyl-2-hydroxymuconate isomerase